MPLNEITKGRPNGGALIKPSASVYTWVTLKKRSDKIMDFDQENPFHQRISYLFFTDCMIYERKTD